jgi:hypothetical protein
MLLIKYRERCRFISVEYFIPILKMSATVELYSEPVTSPVSCLGSFFKKSSVKSSTDLVPNYPEDRFPVKKLPLNFGGGES